MNSRIIANYAVGFLISVLLFPVMLVTSIQLVTYDQNFYASQYARLNTADNIGMSAGDLERVTGELLDYISGRLDSLDNITAEINGEIRPVFNEREKLHMVDVKDLFNFASRVRNISLAGIVLLFIILYYLSHKQPLRFFAASYLTAAAMLLLLLIIAVPIIKSNFTYYWDQFHYLFFDNDLWILNPETDIMIQMVPEPFFNQAVTRVIIYFAAGSLVLGFISFWLLRKSRKRYQINRT
ncbi:MAG TPA: TIGR01906 family membrane protein [Clostridiales bacterium]|nr:TIGR01906 family membrane protein [Clostridiales bacterium]